MPDFDWTTISADIAAAIDFVTEHGGTVKEAKGTLRGSEVVANGDSDTLRSIGGSWEFYTASHGQFASVIVSQEIAGVTLYVTTDDPAVMDAYSAGVPRLSVDWSADND